MGRAISSVVHEENRYFNRELSWLEFNRRVLAEANNPVHPLLERVKFLAIFSNNLDEFVMIHVPGIRERVVEETGRPPNEREILARLDAIHDQLIPLLEQQYKLYAELLPLLAEQDIRLSSYSQLNDREKARLADYFQREVFPVLTPLAISPSHPFPYISNLSLSLAVVMLEPTNGKSLVARVKVPTKPLLPRLVAVPGTHHHYVFLEDIVKEHIGSLFPEQKIEGCYAFRVTRNADLELREDGSDDVREMIEEELLKRRFGEIERLEVSAEMPIELTNSLMNEMGLSEEEVYHLDGPLNLADLFPLSGLDLPELKDTPFVAGIPAALQKAPDIFSAIRNGDILLHHPFQTFNCVTNFLNQAANDPDVLTIKHTLYRSSGDSPILQSLSDAADSGKQVACLIELKARFDEANNLVWARHLEKSGVHVVYGLPGLKTHCKVTLVVRREAGGLRRYCHIGTGNYNPKTAAIYTDLGILTCDPDFGADATELFNSLTGYSWQREYRQFLVAPTTLRARLLALIRREIAHSTTATPGRIIAKMNGLVDTELVELLYEASHSGVQIDLIVRGICTLRPGVADLSENIRVVSVVGRFLEHSRIFYFQNDGEDEIYIGSADWMTRNLDRRIEVVVPVLDASIRSTILNTILLPLLRDNEQAWTLQQDGSYLRKQIGEGETPYNAQLVLLRSLAGHSAERRHIDDAHQTVIMLGINPSADIGNYA